jgi:hypothetical protein
MGRYDTDEVAVCPSASETLGLQLQKLVRTLGYDEDQHMYDSSRLFISVSSLLSVITGRNT